MSNEEANEYLALKWGSLKRWDLKTDASRAALKKFLDGGNVCSSAIMQRNNDEQKAAICELIDVANCDKIFLDWDEKYVSKEEAKKYVMEFDIVPSEGKQ